MLVLLIKKVKYKDSQVKKSNGILRPFILFKIMLLDNKLKFKVISNSNLGINFKSDIYKLPYFQSRYYKIDSIFTLSYYSIIL